MTIGSTLTYGRFTLDEWERRGGMDNPYFEESGRSYRITEAVPNQAKEVRYQAVECDPLEVEAWKAERAPKPAPEPESPPVREVPEYVKKYYGKSTEEDVVPSEEPDEETVEESEPEPGPPPSLQTYAREHGWPGVGRIAQKIKDAYAREHGVG